MPIAAWLASISGPLVMRVLAQLGIGVLTFIGVEAGINSALSYAQTTYLGLPAVVLQFLAIAGVNSALGIMAGGITARLTLMAMKRFQLK